VILIYVNNDGRKFKVLKTCFEVHQKFALNLNDFYKYQVNFLLHGNYFVDHLATKKTEI
jgi:hypothetical protein